MNSARGLVPPGLLMEVEAADAAARAARAVPGVVRLQPGVWGLLRQFAVRAWEQTTGKVLPDIAGVDARLVEDGTRLRVELRIVVSIHSQAAAVGAAVHEAVTVAAIEAAGKPVEVTVHIVEIDLEPQQARPLDG
ncbi:hypothetical protein [Kribbella deserti]|uniref:Asp23/Gls24 family envelope stress response protein n=1 Tax=Kribbella deserti TaxID=1926257 RepID=A0ABV6QNF9_9ACTN